MKDYRTTAPYSDTAIALMEQHGIAMTPENYMLWYTHAAGENPALSRLIDIYQSNGEPFTEERCQELYKRFLAPDGQFETVGRVGDKMQSTIGTMIGGVEENIQNTAAYETFLSNISRAIDSPDIGDRMVEMINKLRAETNFMQDRIGILEKQLNTGASEITALKKQLNEVQQEASTDGLTMVANRKRFDMELRSHAANAVEDDKPLCLIMADIDHFKSFNDTHGHQIGDLVLRLVARTLDLSTKGQDLVARYGGEEFAIVLPETTITAATTLADSIREKMADSQIRLKDKEKTLGRVTLSMGIAQYEPGEPLGMLIERADRCLYEAKQQGRNRVIATNAGSGLVAAE